MINVFTDGSCIGNPGRGGYGVVIKGLIDEPLELSGGEAHTTNNRMEMSAVLQAFCKLNEFGIKNAKIVVQTDSLLIVNTFTKNWKRKENKDLWALIEEQYMKLYSNENQIDFKWIKGHNGHPENERCDFLAKRAAN